MPGLKQHFVELALRRALPRAPLLPLLPYARLGLLGLTAAIVGGLIFTLACAALCGAFFFYLREQGISPSSSLLILAGTFLAVAAWIYFAIQRFIFSKLESVRTLLSPRAPEEALLDIPGAILGNFLQGVLNGDARPRPRS